MRCPCGERTTPDPCCDMCDGWSEDPDTGWGGYTNNFTGKHYSYKEEEFLELENDEDVYEMDLGFDETEFSLT